MYKSSVLALVTLVIWGGCAGTKVRGHNPRSPWEVGLLDPGVRRPSSTLRTQPVVSVGLRVTGLASPAEVPAINGKGRGALAGASLGAHALQPVPFDPYGAALSLLLMPVVTAGGAIYGAVAAPGEEEGNAAHASLKAAMRETDFVMLVRDRMLNRALATTKLTIAPVGDPGENTFDHHLEIEIEGPSLASDGQVNPDVTLVVGAGVCLRGISDKACLYERRWLYRGLEGPYSQVAANDAALLRFDLPAAAERLADRVLMDFTVAMQPEPAYAPEPARTSRSRRLSACGPSPT